MNKQEIEKAIKCCERYKGVAKTYGKQKSAKEDIKSLEVAISALEKQIPKQIEIKDFNLSKSYHCPICKFRFVSKVNGDLVGGMIRNYCPDCGQAIDWRNEDE